MTNTIKGNRDIIAKRLIRQNGLRSLNWTAQYKEMRNHLKDGSCITIKPLFTKKPGTP